MYHDYGSQASQSVSGDLDGYIGTGVAGSVFRVVWRMCLVWRVLL